jgi:hypothetical protein
MQQQCYNERLVQQRYAYYGHKDKAEQMELKACKELQARFGAPAA